MALFGISDQNGDHATQLRNYAIRQAQPSQLNPMGAQANTLLQGRIGGAAEYNPGATQPVAYSGSFSNPAFESMFGGGASQPAQPTSQHISGYGGGNSVMDENMNRIRSGQVQNVQAQNPTGTWQPGQTINPSELPASMRPGSGFDPEAEASRQMKENSQRPVDDMAHLAAGWTPQAQAQRDQYGRAVNGRSQNAAYSGWRGASSRQQPLQQNPRSNGWSQQNYGIRPQPAGYGQTTQHQQTPTYSQQNQRQSLVAPQGQQRPRQQQEPGFQQRY